MENTTVNGVKAAKDHFVAIKCIESPQRMYFLDFNSTSKKERFEIFTRYKLTKI